MSFNWLLQKALEFGISISYKFSWTGYKHKETEIKKKDDKYIWHTQKDKK